MFGRRTRQALAILDARVSTLTQEIKMATIALQRLIDAVAAEKTENASAIAFIKGIPQMIRDAVAAASAAGQTTEAAMDDLAAQLEVSTGDLTAAVAANTPSAPQPPPSSDGNGTGAGADPPPPPPTT